MKSACDAFKSKLIVPLAVAGLCFAHAAAGGVISVGDFSVPSGIGAGDTATLSLTLSLAPSAGSYSTPLRISTLPSTPVMASPSARPSTTSAAAYFPRATTSSIQAEVCSIHLSQAGPAIRPGSTTGSMSRLGGKAMLIPAAVGFGGRHATVHTRPMGMWTIRTEWSQKTSGRTALKSTSFPRSASGPPAPFRNPQRWHS